jgi:hypothetical protein
MMSAIIAIARNIVCVIAAFKPGRLFISLGDILLA